MCSGLANYYVPYNKMCEKSEMNQTNKCHMSSDLDRATKRLIWPIGIWTKDWIVNLNVLLNLWSSVGAYSLRPYSLVDRIGYR
jgi:hypothetical protein